MRLSNKVFFSGRTINDYPQGNMNNPKKPPKGGDLPSWATDNFAKVVQSVSTSITKVLVSATKWGGLAFCFWQAQMAVTALAGKITIAKGDLRVDANAEIDLVDSGCLKIVALAVLIGGIGIIYGIQQSKLRRRAVERLHPFKELYEISVDPDRRSSKLTTTGDTRPEDK